MADFILVTNYRSKMNYQFKIFHRFWLALILHNQLALTKFGRCELYTMNSMAYWLGNEVHQLLIWKRRWHGQKTIDQPRFQEKRRSWFFTSELKIMAFTRLFEDEIAYNILIKTKRKESKNTQNILLDRCYLLFEDRLRSICKKKPDHECVYIRKLCKKQVKV